MKKKVFTALGIMTGTSMDGVDLSVIKSDDLVNLNLFWINMRNLIQNYKKDL